jgi:hypothetical protein
MTHRPGSLRYRDSEGNWQVAEPHSPMFSTVTMLATQVLGEDGAWYYIHEADEPQVDVSKFGTPKSQPPLVEAVLQTGVEFATICERIGEGRGGERAPYRDRFYEAVAALATAPIDMVLHCPKCGMQHIDTDEFPEPHRSHLCRKEVGGCGTIWRPADVATTGVAAVKTVGKNDTWTPGGKS